MTGLKLDVKKKKLKFFNNKKIKYPRHALYNGILSNSHFENQFNIILECPQLW